jgi:hypothetical protein
LHCSACPHNQAKPIPLGLYHRNWYRGGMVSPVPINHQDFSAAESGTRRIEVSVKAPAKFLASWLWLQGGAFG